MVLSRIAPAHAAEIMESMPREMQLEVAVQIGNFQSLPLIIFHLVGSIENMHHGYSLDEKLKSTSNECSCSKFE